jgi:outer membrane protein assembly factor BamB
LFVCGGEGKDRNFSACLQMEVKDGKISCRELYRSTELQTNMYNTVAIDDDAVFGFGGNKRIGFLHCTNLDDGRLLWRQDSEDWTSEQNLVVADGLIFALTTNWSWPRPAAKAIANWAELHWESNWAARSNRQSPTGGCTSAATQR